MKKSIHIFIGLVLLMSATSCEKFLTVNPKTQMTQEVLFSTQDGFKDALTGVYIQMKANTSYGQQLTMTTIEQLISNWDVTTNSTEQRLGLFNYSDSNVDLTLTSIYSQQYKIIASINAILDNIDKNRSLFSNPELYNLIKGECLALRAYCHLDVLRLWGPIPTAVPATNSIPPYVTTLSKLPNPLTSYTSFQTSLLKDLADAEELLKTVDPILKNSLVDLGQPGVIPNTTFNPSDSYFAHRYLRMNYYAIKALQARANLWFGRKSEAYTAAKVVLTATNPDGASKFKLGVLADMTAKDYALTNEQIFGLYVFDLYSRYNTLFANGTLKKGSSATTVTSQLYGNTGTDIREVNLWVLITQPNQTKTYVCQKYNVPQSPGTGFRDLNRIPMLRLSEIYFILIETTTDPAEAQSLWSAFRTARNIPVATLPSDPTQIQASLLSEYRKEFVAEGQSFYAYKRLNTAKTSIVWCPSSANLNYVLPLPKTESLPSN